MKKDYTDITILLDRSGSMADIAGDVTGGLREFVKKQRELTGKCLLTVAQFDSQSYDVVVNAKSVHDVGDIPLHPRGMTPLLDSTARAINETGERLKNMDETERPEFVVFLIVTDGYENDSKEYTKARVKEMIEHQTNVYRWHFSYIGANQDAFEEAHGIGIAAAAAINYATSHAGVRNTYQVLGNTVNALRSHEAACMSYSVSDRDAAMAADDADDVKTTTADVK